MPKLLVFACYAVAIVCFLVSAFKRNELSKVLSLSSLGFALVTLPLAWNAFEALEPH